MPINVPRARAGSIGLDPYTRAGYADRLMPAFPPIESLLDFVPRDVLAKRAPPERPLPELPPKREAAAPAPPPVPAAPRSDGKRRFFADVFGPFRKK